MTLAHVLTCKHCTEEDPIASLKVGTIDIGNSCVFVCVPSRETFDGMKEILLKFLRASPINYNEFLEGVPHRMAPRGYSLGPKQPFLENQHPA